MGEENDYTMFFKSGDVFKPLGKVDSTPATIECAKLEVHKHPRERNYAETKLVYSVYDDEGSRTLKVDTFMTNKELRNLCVALMDAKAVG